MSKEKIYLYGDSDIMIAALNARAGALRSGKIEKEPSKSAGLHRLPPSTSKDGSKKHK